MTHKEIPENHLQLGQLGKTFQLAGGLRFYPLGSAEAGAIFNLKRVFIEGFGESDIREIKETSNDIILFLTAALTIEKAKTLINKKLYASANDLPKYEENAFYLDELLNLDVYLDENLIGTVESIKEAGLQDILTVTTSTGSFMIPLQADYVSVEEDAIYLEDIPEGLLDLNS